MDASTGWPAVPQPVPLYHSPRLNSLVEEHPLAVVDMALIEVFDVLSDSDPSMFGVQLE